MKTNRKPTKCKICRQPFIKLSMSHKVCGTPACVKQFISMEAAKADRKAKAKFAKEQREERREIRAKKEAIKPRSAWMKEAQAAFNKFIRERDKFLPCICCGKPLTLDAIGGGYDCGHYRSTGSAPFHRFNEDNAHAQRKVCNRHGAGRAVDYRIGLIRRIGLAAVEALESDNAARKFTIDDLKAIKEKYKAKLKELQQQEKSGIFFAHSGNNSEPAVRIQNGD